MIRHALMSLAFGVTLAPSMALAAGGSEADQEACTPDVMRLCQDFIPNEGPIVACLESNRRSLSASCSRVIFPVKAAPHTRRLKVKHHKP